MTTPLDPGAPSRRAILAALLGVYLAWGATYVAIAIAVRTLPPLLTGGVRFFTAGALLYACGTLLLRAVSVSDLRLVRRAIGVPS